MSMVEVYMLTVFCQKGFPLVTGSGLEKSELSSPLTWDDVAEALKVLAQQQLQGAEDMVKACTAAAQRAKDQGHKADAVASLEAKSEMAKVQQTARQVAAANTADITADPVGVLGKKR